MSEKTLKEKTANGLVWGALNNFTMQLLSAFIGIVLGRILAPAEYGMVGLLAIFSAVAGTLQESGFTAALTNLKEISHREYNAVFWFSTSISLSLYVILFFSAPLIADFFHQPGLIDLSRLVFASFVVAGLGTAHAAYMFRNMMNREKAIVNTVALICSGIVGISLALNGYSYWSLAWQQFIYISTVNIGRLYYVRWIPNLNIDMKPIKEMFGFSSKILITNIVIQVNNNVLSLVFGRLLSPKAVGNYSQAAKWNTIGYSIISSTIQQVAQPVLSSVNEEEGRQKNIFRKMLRFTAMFSMPAMFGLALIAEFIIVLLGEKWEDSVTLLRILCIGGAFLPIQTLYQNLFISHGRSETYMWSSIAQIVVQLCVVLFFSSWGIIYMVTAYTTVSVLWIMVWQILTRQLTGLTYWDMIKDICPFFISAASCALISYLAIKNVNSHELAILLKFIIMAGLYIAIMKIADVKIFNECIDYLLSRIKAR